MRNILSILGLITLALTACAPKQRDCALFQPSGRQKAIVSVMPVIDHTSGSNEISWDLSREFTEAIRKRIHDSTKVYLLREEGTLEVAKELSTPNPNNILPQRLGATEFVVVTELLEQNQEPIGVASPIHGDAGALINLAIRLRVVDVRGDRPRVVLQEMLTHEHLVAKAYLNTDYVRHAWGSESYQRTPLGIAHSHLVRELVARVENYIDISR